MFLRTSRRVADDGTVYEYAQLVESYRRASDGRPAHKVLASLGRLSPLEIQNFRVALAAGREGKRVAVVSRLKAAQPVAKPADNLQYLDLAVFRNLWREWRLHELFDELLPKDAEVSASNVIASLVLQRCVAPNSKLAATRWFPHTALPELCGVDPKHFNNTRIHRTLEELQDVTPALMAALTRRYAERDGACVTLFLDVTDAHFVGHGPTLAEQAKTKKGMLERKIGIVLLCNERGYPMRWDVIAGSQHDSCAMMKMLRSISRLSWVGRAPVVFDRALGKTAHLREILATKLRFLTALTVTEFETYAPKLPWQQIARLSLEKESPDAAMAKASQQAVAAGMTKVEDDLFVLDFGIIEKTEAEISEDSMPEATSEDITVSAMSLCKKLRLMIDDQNCSLARAATALGLKKALAVKYCRLHALSEDLQVAILDGAAAGRSLAELLRLAKIQPRDQQRAAFEALIKLPKSGRKTPQIPPPDASESPPVRVRAVAYFNPNRFLEQRQNAREKLQRIETFVRDLNQKLASPRSKQTRASLQAALDRRLRRDHLVNAFKAQVTEVKIGGSSKLQVQLVLNEPEWQRRRRYDGFTILVAHPDVCESCEALCRLYRAKDAVEKDFQTIKSVLELRPVRHRTDEKVRAHVTLCMLALLLERTLRERLQPKFTVGEALEHLARIRLNRYPIENAPSVYSITELSAEQTAILRKLKMQDLGHDEALAEQMTAR